MQAKKNHILLRQSQLHFLANKNNTKLPQTLNKGIDELVKNGEIKTIAQKYGME
ncbi:transporter substrate-binding domain-containing protein [Moraxella sp. K127]|uniref:transporter substrate-binding domain-containing protein n=1 Tax=Moraxella TaxID=475 RepID=UPI0012EA8BAF|nr:MULTISPECIES: transporter substrate-binding domain-containing protein [Moraxella]MBE9590549.1 transporter substrate-binding domain-containing protein [Moraxella sp. K127]MDI4481851.1 transporter substrate-binding domain-containing protein [Moraxella lacunata]MDI4506459.1 transporter substrate-binding domain-containing protein [Moraxella lacunata]